MGNRDDDRTSIRVVREIRIGELASGDQLHAIAVLEHQVAYCADAPLTAPQVEDDGDGCCGALGRCVCGRAGVTRLVTSQESREFLDSCLGFFDRKMRSIQAKGGCARYK